MNYDDLISREALKAEFDEKCAGECGVCAYHKWENYASLNAVSHCLLIDNAPTVDIKDEIAGAYNEGYMCGCKEAEKGRPQGEWLKYGDHAWKCSKCNCSVYVRTRNFCPDCGAKMRGLE